MEPEINERFERIESNLDRLVGVVSTLAEVVKIHEGKFVQTQEELSVLIRMMDEWIRSNPRNGQGQPPTT